MLGRLIPAVFSTVTLLMLAFRIAVSSAITWIIWTYILPPYIYETVSKVINDEFIRISETELRDFPTTTYILSSHINLIATLIIDSLSNKIASLALYLFSLSTLIVLILGVIPKGAIRRFLKRPKDQQ